MSDPVAGGSAVDAAHFFTRVLQVGFERDLAECHDALSDRYQGAVSRVELGFIERSVTLDTVERSSAIQEAPEAMPQLERIAGLLLGVGADLPYLRLAGLLKVSSEKRPNEDPWFVQRGIDETSRLSYARRFYDDSASEGNLTVLARTFLVDPIQVAAQLSQLLTPRVVEVDKDWAYLDGSIGSNGQVELETYWDGFASFDIRATSADEFADVASRVLVVLASFVPSPVANIGVALIEAVTREARVSAQ
jgi:hypothetical protein